MTLAISKALEEGAKAVVCASTGNTSASAAAYAARAGMTCAVLIPEGHIALGKLAQALVHGAKVHPGAGQLRRGARHRPSPGGAGAGDRGQLGQPLPDPGPEDRAPSKLWTCWVTPPTSTASPWGTPATSPPTGAGTCEYRDAGALDQAAADVRFPGRRRGPHRRGPSHRAPRDDRHRHPHREPGVLVRGHGGGQRVGGRHRGRDRRGDPRRLPVPGLRGVGVLRGGVGGVGGRADQGRVPPAAPPWSAC